MKQDGMISNGADFILHFPLVRRTELVRKSACALDRLNGPPATEFWRSLCLELKTELFKLGLSYEKTRAEILDFQDAVHGELVRMQTGRCHERSTAAK